MQELSRFPRLHAQLVEVVSELLRERLGPTSEYAQSLIEIQAAYINTNHPAFISGSAAHSANVSIPKVPSRVCFNLFYVSFADLMFFLCQPASAGSTNDPMAEDDDDSSAEDVGGVNGVLRDGRSVSSTVHDRSRTSTITAPAGAVTKQSSRHHQSQQSHRHSIAHSQPVESTKGSPPNARETFLNYFFGQNGPGPIAGSSMERSHGPQHIPIGRDISGTDGAMPGGLMAGKRSLDGNNAAYDMKSLGKHIEAVNNFIPD
jgi:dynamin 1-like protein